MFTVPLKIPTSFIGQTVIGMVAETVNDIIDHLVRWSTRVEELEARIAVLEKGKRK